ncbi:MAG: sulfurtransferase TusA family protein, partial [Lachnospiraceae bacterium]|nr:sulfurtransferase TusA family protein [Lachnospiraceae bacterium]
MKTRVVDARGLACPLPVVNTKKATAELTQGGTVTVLVDNEIAVQNLQKFATQKGYQSMAEKKTEQEYQVTIVVTEEALSNEEVVATEKQDSGIEVKETVTEENEVDSLSCQPDLRQKGLVAVL